MNGSHPATPDSHPRDVRPAEQLLIEAAGPIVASRVLCTSLGRAQFAVAFSRRCPQAQVSCLFLDVQQANLARAAASELTHRSDTDHAASRLTMLCQPDFPDGEVDLAALPCSYQGDGELTRDLLQAAFDRLTISGRLIATTDNPRDQWLHQELRALFPKVTRRPSSGGVAYLATKTEPLRRRRNFECAYAFRDGSRLIRVVTRPGVFSHRHLDVGARALIESLDVAAGSRVLEIGCGGGPVSLAAALRAPQVRVEALDSNPRAVECTRRGAQQNGIDAFEVNLDATADGVAAGQFDLVLANPPYYSRFRIQEIFLRGAARALREDGVLQLVTKHPQDYPPHLEADFRDVTITPVRHYWVVRAFRRASVTCSGKSRS
ncbi:MAG: class I SAM-dependent methyltransferase [Pirellulaceae bacterium]